MSPQETADSTLNFLLNRPLMNVMFLIMRYSCIFLCFGFLITLYQRNTRVEDVVAVITACAWLFFYKSINRKVIKSTLKARKFTSLQRTIKFDDKSIACLGPKMLPIDIQWKKLKFVLKTKQGYIIPLTGLINAGKFIWLPFHAFKDQQEQQFLQYLQQFNLKLKIANN
jgi:hypothetical protein